MKKVIFLPALLASLLLVWMFAACNSDSEPTDESTNIDAPIAAPNPDSSALMDEDKDDPYWYSYNYTDGEVPEPEAAKPTNEKAPKAKTTPQKLKIKDTPVIYTVSQTDRPPLFSADCLTAKNPQRCSNNALADWARKSVKYPEADLAEGSDGLEYVTFVINKDGKVSTINRVDSKQEACEGCSHAVITAMLDMPDWQPAMLGGKPVDVMVTLPVRFRVD
jgi:Gram-negative bacterial TonB protein C-terminal